MPLSEKKWKKERKKERHKRRESTSSNLSDVAAMGQLARPKSNQMKERERRERKAEREIERNKQGKGKRMKEETKRRRRWSPSLGRGIARAWALKKERGRKEENFRVRHKVRVKNKKRKKELEDKWTADEKEEGVKKETKESERTKKEGKKDWHPALKGKKVRTRETRVLYDKTCFEPRSKKNNNKIKTGSSGAADRNRIYPECTRMQTRHILFVNVNERKKERKGFMFWKIWPLTF